MAASIAFQIDPALLAEQAGYKSQQRDRLSYLVGQEIGSDLDLVRLVSDGIDSGIIDRLTNEGLTRRELAFVIPERTLTHRLKKLERLTTAESERGVRVVDLFLLAERVLGDKKTATEWLRQPMRKFDGQSPLEVLRTEQGAHLVENLLIQIDEGYVA
jgi:putative toxin-antitoxin system antitoxin component (TIGR02293 family)